MFYRLLAGLPALLLAAVIFFPSDARPDTVEMLVMPGKVIQGHADIEPECKKCHQPFKKEAQKTLCMVCHEDVAKDVFATQGYHGRNAEKPCRECHSDHLGRTADIINLDEAKFDHKLTDYALLGKHLDTKCKACHAVGKKYREAAHDCYACHKKDDVHKGSLGKGCKSCHTEADWKKSTFDHDKTEFPLRGGHIKPKCSACHKNQNFKETPKDCVSCHREDDVHKGGLGTDCGKCHNDKTWRNTSFDHGKTKFPLLGAHIKTRCLACHKSAAYNDVPPMKCVSCHTKEDVHKGRYGEKCETCHGEASWKEIKFQHDRDTGFRLRDAHAKIKCDACHTGKLYVDKTPKDCNGCHAKKDVHKGDLGTACDKCHLETEWKKTKFNHDKDTKYPLLGKHAEIKCKACHIDGTFRQKLPMDCMSCHKKDDKHAGQQGTKCEQCHEESSWKKTRFDHARSIFPLTGGHLAVKCNACHKSLKFKDAAKECIGCHTKEDVHKGRLGAACADCHNTRDWRAWDFDHDKRTSFLLDGAHKKLECVACHTRAGKKIPPLAKACIACHEKDDVHAEAFGKLCDRCHVTSTFKEIRK